MAPLIWKDSGEKGWKSKELTIWVMVVAIIFFSFTIYFWEFIIEQLNGFNEYTILVLIIFTLLILLGLGPFIATWYEKRKISSLGILSFNGSEFIIKTKNEEKIIPLKKIRSAYLYGLRLTLTKSEEEDRSVEEFYEKQEAIDTKSGDASNIISTYSMIKNENDSDSNLKKYGVNINIFDKKSLAGILDSLMKKEVKGDLVIYRNKKD